MRTQRSAGTQQPEALYSHYVDAARCWNATTPRYASETAICADRWNETCARHTEKCWNATTRSTLQPRRTRSEVLERNNTSDSRHSADTSYAQRGAGMQHHRGTFQRLQYEQTDGMRRAHVTILSSCAGHACRTCILASLPWHTSEVSADMRPYPILPQLLLYQTRNLIL